MITIGDMVEGDLLMDDEGDFFRIEKIELLEFASIKGKRQLSGRKLVELECLTLSESSLTWSAGVETILLNEEWVWHSRFGPLD